MDKPTCLRWASNDLLRTCKILTTMYKEHMVVKIYEVIDCISVVRKASVAFLSLLSLPPPSSCWFLS